MNKLAQVFAAAQEHPIEYLQEAEKTAAPGIDWNALKDKLQGEGREFMYGDTPITPRGDLARLVEASGVKEPIFNLKKSPNAYVAIPAILQGPLASHYNPFLGAVGLGNPDKAIGVAAHELGHAARWHEPGLTKVVSRARIAAAIPSTISNILAGKEQKHEMELMEKLRGKGYGVLERLQALYAQRGSTPELRSMARRHTIPAAISGMMMLPEEAAASLRANALMKQIGLADPARLKANIGNTAAFSTYAANAAIPAYQTYNPGGISRLIARTILKRYAR